MYIYIYIFVSLTGASGGEGSTATMTSGQHHLVVEQVRILDEDGVMKVTYPARNDLLNNAFKVIRDYE